MIEVLENGGYCAGFMSRGGTCISLRKLDSGAEILRTPKNEEEWAREPFLYGNPPLFPCNRIRGGSFRFDGREYKFPINEKNTGCYLHGELWHLPFRADRTAEGIRYSYDAAEGELGFPQALRFVRDYRLDEQGLHENFSVENKSALPLPVMLAFHTTFRIPFLAGGDCRMKLNVKREQLRDENYLPTGKYAEGRERDNQLVQGSFYPDCTLSALYEADGEMLISDSAHGLAVRYRADSAFAYRMLFSAGRGFVVCEPQTCAIDCFHLRTPPQQNGLIVVSPWQTLQLKTDIALISLENV